MLVWPWSPILRLILSGDQHFVGRRSGLESQAKLCFNRRAVRWTPAHQELRVRDDILLFPRVRLASITRPVQRRLEPEVDTSLSREDDITAGEPKQFPESETLTNWLRAQESLADKTGVALGTLESESSRFDNLDNDNSICREMLASAEHAHLCALDCGRAYSRAAMGPGVIEFRCHAGLQCFAAPLTIGSKRLVLLGGRAFRSPSDYSECLRRYSDLKAIASGK